MSTAPPRSALWPVLALAVLAALLEVAFAPASAGRGRAGPTPALLPLSPPALIELRSAMLRRIAGCESGGDPAAVSADGRYRGKYQFDLETWQTVGGVGDPAAASEREQDERARVLLTSRGAVPWPVCGLGPNELGPSGP